MNGMRRSLLVRSRVLLTCVLALLAGCETTVVAGGAEPSGTAQDGRFETVHPEARRAISEIRSPYCPGLMLEVCPSPDAAVLRDSIDTLARSGILADSIVELMIARYGEEWRAVPRREGAGWWAWLMPAGVLLLGLLTVAVVLSRRRRGVVPAGGSEPTRPEDEEKLRRAMSDLDESEHPEW
ncbi:MAG: cytochrome c-type biogenesis protein CcmH [Gemmatimonadota bacterium]